MAVVYKAFDQRLKRHAVLKTFFPETPTSADVRRRPEREAQAHLKSSTVDAVTIASRRSPDDRFKSIADFRTALLEGVSGLLPSPIGRRRSRRSLRIRNCHRSRSSGRTRPPAKRPHTTLAWTVSLTVVLLSVVASVALLLKHSPPPVKNGGADKDRVRAGACRTAAGAVSGTGTSACTWRVS